MKIPRCEFGVVDEPTITEDAEEGCWDRTKKRMGTFISPGYQEQHKDEVTLPFGNLKPTSSSNHDFPKRLTMSCELLGNIFQLLGKTKSFGKFYEFHEKF